MRIGEILVEAGLITPKQLSSGLEYAQAKTIPIGRCLTLLNSLSDEDLQRALRAQQVLRKGLSAETAIKALKDACANCIEFDAALQAHYDHEKQNPPLQTSQPGAVTGALQKSAIQAVIAEKEGTDPQELLKLGDQLFYEDSIETAEKLYLKAKKQLELKYGIGSIETVPALVKLGHLFLVSDRSELAEQMYSQSLHIRQQTLGDDSLSVADSMEDLADLSQARGETDRARHLFNDAFAIREKHLPDDIDRYIHNIKKTLVITQPESDPPRLKIGELLSEAALLTSQQLQQALQFSKTKGIPVGNALKECGFITERILDAALNVQLLVRERQIHARFAPQVVRAAMLKEMELRRFLQEYGLLTDKDEDKSPEYRNLIVEQDRLIATENNLGPEHPEVAQIASRLAKAYQKRGNLVDAEMLYARVLKILAKVSDADPRLHADAALSLGQLHTNAKRYNEAQPILLKALELSQKSGSNGTFACLIALAAGEHAQRNDAAACSFLRSAAAIPAQGSSVTDDDLKWIINVLLDNGCSAEAENLLLNQIKQCEVEFGPLEPEVAAKRRLLGDYYVERKEVSKAQGQYYLALQIFDRGLSDPDGNAAILREKLEQLNVSL